MAACKSCGAAILWRRNPKTGRMAPIDAAASPRGNIGIGPETYELCNAKLSRVECGEHNGHHTNHFATCPQAAMHHKTRGKP